MLGKYFITFETDTDIAWEPGFRHLPLSLYSWNFCYWQGHVWLESSLCFLSHSGSAFLCTWGLFLDVSFFSGLWLNVKIGVYMVCFTQVTYLFVLCFPWIGLPHSKSAYLQHTTGELFVSATVSLCSPSFVPCPYISTFQPVFALLKTSAIIRGL